jgi:hypothetical protein
MQHGATSGTGEPTSHGEQPQTLGLPPAGWVLGQRERLGPGDEFAGQRDDGAPDPVLVQVVQGQVGQSGVLRASDAVLGAGSAAVAQFEVGELAVRPAGWGVGCECGQPVPVGVGQPQLRAGVRPLLADDHPHPCWPAVRHYEQGLFADGQPSPPGSHLCTAVAQRVGQRMRAWLDTVTPAG